MGDRLSMDCFHFPPASVTFFFLSIYFLINKAKYEDFNLFAVDFYLLVSVILRIQCKMEKFLIHLLSQSIYVTDRYLQDHEKW